MSGYDGEGTGVEFGDGGNGGGAEFAGPGLSLGARGVGLAATVGTGYSLGGGLGTGGVQARGSDLAAGLGDRGAVSVSIASMAVDRSGDAVSRSNIADQQTRNTVALLQQIPVIGPAIGRMYAAYNAASGLSAARGISTTAPGRSTAALGSDGLSGAELMERGPTGGVASSPIVGYTGAYLAPPGSVPAARWGIERPSVRNAGMVQGASAPAAAGGGSTQQPAGVLLAAGLVAALLGAV